MRLYHHTCSDHGAPGIQRDGVLRPHGHPLLPQPLVWLTSLEVPNRAGLGLTSLMLKCDRTERTFAVEVSEEQARWWPLFAVTHVPHGVQRVLESAPGALPTLWWVATEELPIAEVLAS